MKLPKLLSALADSAEQYPERIAVVADKEEWTYRQLWELISNSGAELSKLPLPAKTPIAVTAHKSIATLALMLALGQRGHTPLALSPSLGPAVKPAIFKSAGIYCELSAVLKNHTLTLAMPVDTVLDGDATPNVKTVMSSPLMLTTSGSTGIPKVVSLSADGINAFFDWAARFFKLGQESRVLSYAPLNFDLSLLEVWAPLALGGTVIFTNPNGATQADYLASLIRKTRPQIIQGVPLFYSLLCEGAESTGSPPFEAEHVIFTGDVTHRALRQRVAGFFPEASFHNIYGCTETNDSFVHSSTVIDVAEFERQPLGSPIHGTTYRIVDDEGEILKGVGEGELHTSTPFLAQGYTDPGKSVAAFYRDNIEGRRYYKTGDRVIRDEDGTVTLLGRTDYIVKVRGVRTNLQDIERTISLSESVHEVVVVPVEDDLAGVTLHAVIEPAEGKKFDGLALRMLCAQHLPQTSVPRRFHIHENPIPRTSTGKPDRKTIAQSIQAKEA